MHTYPIENIVRGCTRLPTEKLNILLLNAEYDDFISRLCLLPHHFFMFQEHHAQPVWHGLPMPDNLQIYKKANDCPRTHFDFIIVFNRADSYVLGKKLSDTLHVPIIVVDIASYDLKVPTPVLAHHNITDPNELVHHNGIIDVGIKHEVTQSWLSSSTEFAITIPFPTMKYTINPFMDAGKILIDSSLPKEYLQSLPFDINSPMITTQKTQAVLYLHLWQNMTPLMLDCMANNLPVVTLESTDLQTIMQQEACVLIEDLQVVSQTKFLEEILQFEMLQKAKASAKAYVEQYHNIKTFKFLWQQAFKYARKGFYMR